MCHLQPILGTGRQRKFAAKAFPSCLRSRLPAGNPRLPAISKIGKEDISTSLALTVKSTSSSCSLGPAVGPQRQAASDRNWVRNGVTVELQLCGLVLFPVAVSWEPPRGTSACVSWPVVFVFSVFSSWRCLLPLWNYRPSANRMFSCSQPTHNKTWAF